MLLLILVLIGVLAWSAHLWQVSRKYKTIPGNFGFPIIGNLLQLTKNCWFTTNESFYKFLENAYDKYGRTCCFWYYSRVMIATCDPKVAEKLYSLPSLISRPKFVYFMIEYFSRHVFSIEMGGDEWKLRRKELSSSLRKTEHAIIVEKANKLVEIFSAKSGQFDCMPDTMLMTIETTLATQFGLNADLSGKTTLVEVMHFSISKVISSTFTNPILGLISIPIGEYVYFPKEIAVLEDFVVKELLNHAKEFKTDKEEKINLPLGLSVALRNMDKKTPAHEIKKEVSEIIATVSHTTGTATAAALVYLATNPHVQEKAWQEQQMIFGDSERDITPDDLKRMEYLDRYFNELMRFTSPPIIFKETTEDIDVDGMIIPANTLVVIDAYKMHLDNKYWNNPMSFEPDRFLEENISKTPKCLTYFFGYGPRSCPGNKYARHNIKLVLSTILRKFKLTSSISFDKIKHSRSIMVEIMGKYNISLERRSNKKSL